MQTREEPKFLKEKRTGKRSEANLLIIFLIKKYQEHEVNYTSDQYHLLEKVLKNHHENKNKIKKIKEIKNASAIQRNNKLGMKTNWEVQKGKNIDKGIVC